MSSDDDLLASAVSTRTDNEEKKHASQNLQPNGLWV